MVVTIEQEFDIIKVGNEVLEQIFPMDQFDIDQINEACKMIPDDYCTTIDRYFIEESAGFNKLGVGTSKVNKAAKEIVGIAKKEGATQASKKKIQNIVSELFEDLAHEISYKKILENDKVKEIPRKKLASAGILLLWTLIINSLASVVLTLITGPTVGMQITIVVVAPLVEESAKQISMKGNFDKEFYILFNAFEATSYIARFIPTIIQCKLLDGSAKEAIKGIFRARGAAIGMHTVTTVIHKIFENEKTWKMLKIKDEKEAKDMATLIAFILGVLVHATWNTAGTFSPKFQTAIAGTDKFTVTGNN